MLFVVGIFALAMLVMRLVQAGRMREYDHYRRLMDMNHYRVMNHPPETIPGEAVTVIREDDFGNIIVNTGATDYGVMDENRNPILSGYSYIMGVEKNYFLAYSGTVRNLIDQHGTIILEDVRTIQRRSVAGRRLVCLNSGRNFLFSFADRELNALDYEQVYLIRNPAPDASELHAKYYVAIRNTGECFPGTDLPRRKSSILNGYGEPIFEQEYDQIRVFTVDERHYFAAGSGDWQLWQYYTEHSERVDYMPEGSMTEGILGEAGTFIIPQEYQQIDDSYLQHGLLVVRKGSRPWIFDGYNEDLDEYGPVWEMRGGLSGVLNLQGAIVIPAEYFSIELRGSIIEAQRMEGGQPELFDLQGAPLKRGN